MQKRTPIVRILIRSVLLGGATIVALQIRSDPDLWGHLRLGLDFWSTFTVPTIDPYSFTSDRAWINHEWFFDVIVALAYALGGTVALSVTAATVGLSALAVARTSARRADMEGWRLDVLTSAVFLLGVAPLVQTLRAQAISSLLFVLLLAIMREFDRGRRQALVALPPLFLVWANIHGAWVMGGAVLAMWTLTRIAEHPTTSLRLTLLGAGVASAAVTLVNPYGVELWRFLLETLSFERSDIIEWGALTSRPIMFVAWIPTAAIALVGLARSRREHLAYGAICVVLGVASFRVMRLVPFFSLATLLLLGPLLASRSVSPRVRIDVRGWVGGALIWVICVAASTMGETRLGCLERIGSFYVDDRAASFLQENGAKGRLLVWFDWGEYVTWHFGSRLKVSMDGRRETAYSAATIAAHTNFYRNRTGARDYLERLAPDYVWLPRSLPVSAAIAQWGWQPVFETDKSIVWARGNAPRAWRPPLSATTSCFPAA